MSLVQPPPINIITRETESLITVDDRIVVTLESLKKETADTRTIGGTMTNLVVVMSLDRATSAGYHLEERQVPDLEVTTIASEVIRNRGHQKSGGVTSIVITTTVTVALVAFRVKITEEATSVEAVTEKKTPTSRDIHPETRCREIRAICMTGIKTHLTRQIIN